MSAVGVDPGRGLEGKGGTDTPRTRDLKALRRKRLAYYETLSPAPSGGDMFTSRASPSVLQLQPSEAEDRAATSASSKPPSNGSESCNQSRYTHPTPAPHSLATHEENSYAGRPVRNLRTPDLTPRTSKTAEFKVHRREDLCAVENGYGHETPADSVLLISGHGRELAERPQWKEDAADGRPVTSVSIGVNNSKPPSPWNSTQKDGRCTNSVLTESNGPQNCHSEKVEHPKGRSSPEVDIWKLDKSPSRQGLMTASQFNERSYCDVAMSEFPSQGQHHNEPGSRSETAGSVLSGQSLASPQRPMRRLSGVEDEYPVELSYPCSSSVSKVEDLAMFGRSTYRIDASNGPSTHNYLTASNSTRSPDKNDDIRRSILKKSVGSESVGSPKTARNSAKSVMLSSANRRESPSREWNKTSQLFCDGEREADHMSVGRVSPTDSTEARKSNSFPSPIESRDEIADWGVAPSKQAARGQCLNGVASSEAGTKAGNVDEEISRSNGCAMGGLTPRVSARDRRHHAARAVSEFKLCEPGVDAEAPTRSHKAGEGPELENNRESFVSTGLSDFFRSAKSPLAASVTASSTVTLDSSVDEGKVWASRSTRPDFFIQSKSSTRPDSSMRSESSIQPNSSMRPHSSMMLDSSTHPESTIRTEYSVDQSARSSSIAPSTTGSTASSLRRNSAGLEAVLGKERCARLFQNIEAIEGENCPPVGDYDPPLSSNSLPRDNMNNSTKFKENDKETNGSFSGAESRKIYSGEMKESLDDRRASAGWKSSRRSGGGSEVFRSVGSGAVDMNPLSVFHPRGKLSELEPHVDGSLELHTYRPDVTGPSPMTSQVIGASPSSMASQVSSHYDSSPSTHLSGTNYARNAASTDLIRHEKVRISFKAEDIYAEARKVITAPSSAQEFCATTEKPYNGIPLETGSKESGFGKLENPVLSSENLASPGHRIADALLNNVTNFERSRSPPHRPAPYINPSIERYFKSLAVMNQEAKQWEEPSPMTDSSAGQWNHSERSEFQRRLLRIKSELHASVETNDEARFERVASEIEELEQEAGVARRSLAAEKSNSVMRLSGKRIDIESRGSFRSEIAEDIADSEKSDDHSSVVERDPKWKPLLSTGGVSCANGVDPDNKNNASKNLDQKYSIMAGSLDKRSLNSKRKESLNSPSKCKNYSSLSDSDEEDISRAKADKSAMKKGQVSKVAPAVNAGKNSPLKRPVLKSTSNSVDCSKPSDSKTNHSTRSSDTSETIPPSSPPKFSAASWLDGNNFPDGNSRPGFFRVADSDAVRDSENYVYDCDEGGRGRGGHWALPESLRDELSFVLTDSRDETNSRRTGNGEARSVEDSLTFKYSDAGPRGDELLPPSVRADLRLDLRDSIDLVTRGGRPNPSNAGKSVAVAAIRQFEFDSGRGSGEKRKSKMAESKNPKSKMAESKMVESMMAESKMAESKMAKSKMAVPSAQDSLESPLQRTNQERGEKQRPKSAVPKIPPTLVKSIGSGRRAIRQAWKENCEEGGGVDSERRAMKNRRAMSASTRGARPWSAKGPAPPEAGAVNPPQKFWQSAAVPAAAGLRGSIDSLAGGEGGGGVGGAGGGRRRPASVGARSRSVRSSAAERLDVKGAPVDARHTSPTRLRSGPPATQLAAARLEEFGKFSAMSPRVQRGELSMLVCFPDEILLRIFSSLGHCDLARCVAVCRQFERIGMDSSLWRNIELRDRSVTDECLAAIGRRQPISLSLVQCTGEQASAEGVRELFRQCADTLRALSFPGCTRGPLTGDSLLLHATSRCHQLTRVDASWSNVNDSGVIGLSEACQGSLESLGLSGCQAITDAAIQSVVIRHGHSLRELQLSGLFSLTHESAQAVSAHCRSLTSLNLGHCWKLTDSSIAHMSTGLGRLLTLDLRGCKQLRDHGVHQIARNCPRLQSLSLSNCPLITDSALAELSARATQLTLLDVAGCTKVTNVGFKTLVAACPALERLDVSATAVNHRGLAALASLGCERLQALKLNHCRQVSVDSLQRVVRHCRRLKTLCIYGVASVRSKEDLLCINPSLTIEM